MRSALVRLSNRNAKSATPTWVDIKLDYTFAPPVVPIMGVWSCLPGFLSADYGRWDIEHNTRVVLIANEDVIAILGGVETWWMTGYPFELLLGAKGDFLRLSVGGVIDHEGKWEFLAI